MKQTQHSKSADSSVSAELGDPNLDLPNMSGPAIYRICVVGRIDNRRTDLLAGMNVTNTGTKAGEEQTILVGRLPDQVALYGILKILHEMHLPVTSVQCLETG